MEHGGQTRNSYHKRITGVAKVHVEFFIFNLREISSSFAKASIKPEEDLS